MGTFDGSLTFQKLRVTSSTGINTNVEGSSSRKFLTDNAEIYPLFTQ